MPLILITALVILTVAILAILIWIGANNAAARRQIAGQTSAVMLLQQQLDTLKAAQELLKDTLTKNLQTGQGNIGKNLQASAETLTKLHTQIGQLQGTNKQMLQVGTEVRRLQDILSSPKLRGQLGEWSLENILNNILPHDSFKLQHQFRDGKKVDALIKLPDYCVPIDAKFPLSSFQAILTAQTDEQKNSLRKQFARDVKKHIDDIAVGYIQPDEGTLDFALMYIPAENVYYETIAKYDGQEQNILDYGLAKKVIPVSPNVLYAYLMTVTMGLRGLQIEQKAEQINRNLKKLNAHFANFTADWEVLGTHLRNAYNKYEDGHKKFDRFTMHLEQIQTSDQTEEP